MNPLKNTICILSIAALSTTAYAASSGKQKATCYLFNGDVLKVKERCTVESGYAMGESYAGFKIKGTEFSQMSTSKRDRNGNYTDEESHALLIDGKYYDAQYINRNKYLKRKSIRANYQDGDMTCYLIKPKQINVCYQTH